ncbi:hypothetical protein HZS_2997, partial [Henneguya salminicola]
MYFGHQVTSTKSIDIGWQGYTVEIEEAKSGTLKYNRGRLEESVWIFGGMQEDKGDLSSANSDLSVKLLKICIYSNYYPSLKYIVDFTASLIKLKSLKSQTKDTLFETKISKLIHGLFAQRLIYIHINMALGLSKYFLSYDCFLQLNLLEFYLCIIILRAINKHSAHSHFPIIYEFHKKILFSNIPPNYINTFMVYDINTQPASFCFKISKALFEKSHIDQEIDEIFQNCPNNFKTSELICALKMIYIYTRESGYTLSEKSNTALSQNLTDLVSRDLDYLDTISLCHILNLDFKISQKNIFDYLIQLLLKFPEIYETDEHFQSLVDKLDTVHRSSIIHQLLQIYATTQNLSLLNLISVYQKEILDFEILNKILSEITNFPTFCRLVVKFFNVNLAQSTLNRVFSVSLLDSDDETLIMYFEILYSTSFFSNHQQVVTKIIEQFLSSDCKILKTFKQQHRFVTCISKITVLFCEIDPKLFEKSFEKMIECSLNFSQTFIPLMFTSIKTTLNKLSLKLMEFYHFNCNLINRPFLNQILQIEDDKLSSTFLNMVFNLNLLFDHKDSSILISYLICESIKLAVHKRLPNLIQVISSIKNCTKQELLLNHSRYIFPEIFIKCDDKQKIDCINFIEDQISVSITNILKSELQPIVHHCFLYLHDFETNILTGILGMLDSDPFSVKYTYKKGQLSNFFQTRLLGILAFFSITLVSGDLSYKKFVIKSLGKLIEHASRPSIDRLRLKILALLKFATEICVKHNLVEHILISWSTFIENISEKFLGSLMSQIIFSVLPLISYNQELVFSVLDKILIENARITHSHLREVHLFCFTPSFKNLYEIFAKFWTKNIINTNLDTFLEEFYKSLCSDQIDLRRAAIINFSDFLVQRWYTSSSFMLDKCDKKILFLIMNQLLKCCNDPRSQFLFEAGRCLGILGSIDYSNFAQFDQEHTIYRKIARIPIDDTSLIDDFGKILLNELANAFLVVSESQYQDCAAYAIQEITAVYKFSTNPSKEKHLLNYFTDVVQEVIIPHLTSSYSSKSTPCKKTSDILFGISCSSYKDWIKLWCSTLISSLSDGKFRSSLLKPCYAITRYYVPIAELLLPYLIIILFDENPSWSDCISKEILHILKLVQNNSRINECEIKAVETIFEIFDFLTDYLIGETSEALKTTIHNFLAIFCKKNLCIASLACKSYARSLKYLEKYVSEQTDKNFALFENLYLFKQIYYSLNDYDGIIGASRVHPSNQPDSSPVLQMTIEGRFSEAIACHEKDLSSTHDTSRQLKILECYLNLGQFQSLLCYCDNLKGDIKSAISLKMEALWRLGSWSDLENLIASHSQPDSINIAEVLLSLQKNSPERFKNTLISAYKNEAKNLAMMGSKTYLLKRCTPQLAKLHILFDIEMYSQTAFESLNIFNLPENIYSMCQISQKCDRNFNLKLLPLSEWSKNIQSRLDSSEISFDVREPLINTHRVLHDLMPREDTKANHWVCCARLARKCGYFQTAFNYLLNSGKASSNNLSYIYEMTKFLIQTRSEHEALAFLRKHIPTKTPSNNDTALVYSNLRLTLCKLMTNTSDCSPAEILKSYTEAITAGKNLEKVYFNAGNYLDKLVFSKTAFLKFGNPFRSSEGSIIHHYGSSLKYGYKYLYRSLPRLITLWLDYPSYTESIPTSSISNEKTSSTSAVEIKKGMEEICEIVRNFCKILHPFVFLCVLPQLVSRICHPIQTVWEILSALLTKLFISFPHQVSWQMIGIAHSTISNRVKRCKIIFDAAAKENNSIGSMITNLTIFTSNLLEISNKKEKTNHINLSQSFPTLKAMISQQKLSNIMVPLLSTLTCNVPANLNTSNYSFFMNPLPCIVNINERIDVLSSLIRPKKIILVASDGKKYAMLCKPKDDLRRDNRLMEFNSLVNKLLNKNAKARKRNLSIHLYAVIPLNDECGIIEWVNDTISFRNIIIRLYNERKAGIPIEELKKIYLATQRNPEALLTLYTEKILPAFPPVFHHYFHQKFSDASSWYVSRQLYMRSAAVMSMVGFILGLGDRHGENILFVNTGEVVHVDFNCLFNKGDTFEWPEKVPFRLTQNMVDAMGPLGYESCFRSCCEITMEVMRSKQDSLLGVLSTFLHDPLVEWVKSKKNSSVSGEQGNEMAKKMLNDVKNRLLGITPQSHFTISLSVQGKVHQLIQEATSIKNLSQMYFG